MRECWYILHVVYLSACPDDGWRWERRALLGVVSNVGMLWFVHVLPLFRKPLHAGLFPVQIYAGDRLESSRERHGFGGTLYTNGDLFVGEYRYGVRYEGVYVHATSHDIYRGTFNSKGLRHGQGKIWYNDESVYEGL